MRKLGRNSSDSLELLLDTVCSMFGAILLIAILVALMAQTTKVESSGTRASAEMLRRKIATAEADLTETQRLTSLIPVPSESSTKALITEKQQLAQSLAMARAQKAQLSTALQNQVTQQTVDFSSEWKKLTADLQALERRQEEAANSIKAQDQNNARLEGRIAEISKLIQQETDARVVTLRFPKERSRTKRAQSVICKFGKIYPVIDAEGRKNESTISWQPRGKSAELSRPIEAAGWTTTGQQAAINQYLASLPKAEAYLVFYVYPDSFTAFRSMRDQAAAAQIEFGVELEQAGDDLIWGAGGSTPPPL